MKTAFHKLHNEVDQLLNSKSAYQENLSLNSNFPDFEIEENFSRLEIPDFESIEDKNERLIILFSRLSLSYESGLLFQKNQIEDFSLQLGFYRGEVYSIQENPLIHLPVVSHNEVLKLKSLNWFDKNKIKLPVENINVTHLLFQPWPEVAMILSTKMGDPWLKIHAEKTLDFLNLHFIND